MQAATSKVKQAERVLDAAQKELAAAQKRDAERKVKKPRGRTLVAGNQAKYMALAPFSGNDCRRAAARVFAKYIVVTILQMVLVGVRQEKLFSPCRSPPCERLFFFPVYRLVFSPNSPPVLILCYPEWAGATRQCRQIQD